MKYSQTLIDDEYESSNIASQKEFLVILISVTLGIPIYINCGPHCNKNLMNITGIIGDGMGTK